MNNDEGFSGFEGGININDILNDASLNAELISLGWGEAPFPVPPPRSMPSYNAYSQQQCAAPANSAYSPAVPTSYKLEKGAYEAENFDYGAIGMIDESTITLTEQDMTDESLLNEFESLNKDGGDVHTHVEYPAQLTDAFAHLNVASDSSAAMESNYRSNHYPTAPVQSAPQAPAPPSAAVEEAKRTALRHKREGNVTEAVKWLRYAKQLASEEGGGSSKGAPAPATTSTPLQAQVQVQAHAPPPLVCAPIASSFSVNSRAPAPAPTTTAAKSRPAPPLSTQQQQQQQSVPISSSSSSSVPAPSLGDPFGPLEGALAEASREALRDAKAAEKSDPKRAVLHMREYKALAQEMAVLKSRRGLEGARPALFHWQVGSP
jgi:hypothetical protein